jgi:hypothetical protein
MTSTPDRTEHAADEMNEAVGPDVKIPGPFPTGSAPTSKEAAESDSHPSEPAKAPRSGESLGDLTKDVSTSAVPDDSGGLGSAIYDDEDAGAGK